MSGLIACFANKLCDVVWSFDFQELFKCHVIIYLLHNGIILKII